MINPKSPAESNVAHVRHSSSVAALAGLIPAAVEIVDLQRRVDSVLHHHTVVDDIANEPTPPFASLDSYALTNQSKPKICHSHVLHATGHLASDAHPGAAR